MSYYPAIVQLLLFQDNTKVEVVFDLRKFPDFQIKFIEYDLAGKTISHNLVLFCTVLSGTVAIIVISEMF